MKARQTCTKTYSVQGGKNRKGWCCEGTSWFHAHKSMKRAEKQDFSKQKSRI